MQGGSGLLSFLFARTAIVLLTSLQNYMAKFRKRNYGRAGYWFKGGHKHKGNSPHAFAFAVAVAMQVQFNHSQNQRATGMRRPLGDET